MYTTMADVVLQNWELLTRIYGFVADDWDKLACWFVTWRWWAILRDQGPPRLERRPIPNDCRADWIRDMFSRGWQARIRDYMRGRWRPIFTGYGPASISQRCLKCLIEAVDKLIPVALNFSAKRGSALKTWRATRRGLGAELFVPPVRYSLPCKGCDAALSRAGGKVSYLVVGDRVTNACLCEKCASILRVVASVKKLPPGAPRRAEEWFRDWGGFMDLEVPGTPPLCPHLKSADAGVRVFVQGDSLRPCVLCSACARERGVKQCLGSFCAEWRTPKLMVDAAGDLCSYCRSME